MFFWLTPMIETENRLSAIMEVMPHIAWTITVDAQAEFFNQRWYDYTGLDFEQTKGYGWQQVIHPDDLQNALDACLLIRESGIASDIELRYRRHDGIYRWFLTRLQPIKGIDGQVEYWVGTSTDIDELKQLQQQKDDFIGMASHELKSPLTSLSMSIQMLQKLTQTDISSADIPLYVKRAGNSLAKLVKLLDDLVSITKVQQGQAVMNKKWIDLPQLVHECCEQDRVSSKHKIEVKGDESLKVCADHARIEQVITNLVNNAIKYSPRADRVEITVQHDEENAKVSVTDFGIGIVPDKIPNLFKRYYRADPSMMQFTGLGLGLYICSEIIRQHDGQIWVESELGKGSTFWFTIPLNG